MSERQRKIKIQVLPDIRNKDLPEQSQSSLSPQSEPMVIRTAENQISGALMIEHAFLQGTTVELHGWSVGHCEFALLCGEQSIPCQLTRRTRKDVAEALAVAESGDGLGFCIQATATSLENCLLGWSLNVEGHVSHFGFPLRTEELSVAHGMATATVAGANDQSLQVFSSKSTSKLGQICFDRFIGPYAHGWAINERNDPCALHISLGNHYLGTIQPTSNRFDVQDAFDLENARVGFNAMLGGLLQYSAMSKGCQVMNLFRPGQPKVPSQVKLTDYLVEALTFSPLRAFSRNEGQEQLGQPRAMRFLSGVDVILMYEAGISTDTSNAIIFIDFYQEHTPGQLTRLERFEVSLTGQIINLPFKLTSRFDPILIVVSDLAQNIILTDSILMPFLFMENNTPIIEYHSTLSNGRQYYETIAVITRNCLDIAIKKQLKEFALPEDKPNKDNTALIVYVGDDFDPLTDQCADDFVAFSKQIILLSRNGDVCSNEQARLSLADFIEPLTAKFFIICELNTTLRPDFWAIIAQNTVRLETVPDLIHWDYILTTGVQRPYLIKQPLLLDKTFRDHDLLHTNSIIVRKPVLTEALKRRPEDFRSGLLKIEHVFCELDMARVTRIPVALAVSRIGLPIPKQKECWDKQTPIRRLPTKPEFNQTGGVSIIINYRDSEQQTLRCLDSIRLQNFSDEIELILVNNGSMPEIVKSISDRAIKLFGDQSVITLDYNKTFNHSKQCNIAAKQARHDFLLMLSNDSMLITPDALAIAREVAALSWVGTCGFRIIGNKNGKPSLQSLGLAVGRNSDIFTGGRFLTTNLAPEFALDKTLEVIGNTFAAVMLRKDVYHQLNGLDEVMFPTNYNDVDFCLRASALSYRHVAIGAAVVEHFGRGSREFDLDLPIEQSIYDRAPPLKTLVSIGTVKL